MDTPRAPPLDTNEAIPAEREVSLVQSARDALIDGADAFRDFVGTRLLVALVTGWFAVRLCAPDALHLVWDSSTIEIVFGVVFPLTYAIGQSFARREKAVEILANMKTAALSLWFLHRDQDQQAHHPHNGPAAKPGIGGVLAHNVAHVLQDLMCSVRGYLQAAHVLIPGKETPTTQLYLNRVLVAHSTLSVLNERLVMKNHQANGVISRVDEYRRVLMLGFEQLRGLRQYQSSPLRLQRFCNIMVHLTPMILAPYFRHYCHDYNRGLGVSPQDVCIPAYLSSTIFSAVLCTLLRVANDIADPWDGIGQDDLRFEVPEELEWATRAAPLEFDDCGRVVFSWPHGLTGTASGQSGGQADSPLMVELRRVGNVVRQSFDGIALPHRRAPEGGSALPEHDDESDALLHGPPLIRTHSAETDGSDAC